MTTASCRRIATALVVLGLFTILAGDVAAQTSTCNGRSEISYITPNDRFDVGDTLRARISLGAGTIQNGTRISITRVRFELDCLNTGPLSLQCSDEGAIVSFQGNISTSCEGIVWAASHGPGDAQPNQVVFTASTAVIAAAASAFPVCSVDFDLRVEALSRDGTPGFIEQAAGFAASDAVCDTTPPLGATNSSTGSLPLCPPCDDGNVCNGLEQCLRKGSAACSAGTPLDCNDQNACTDDSCDPAAGCVNQDNSARCNDQNACTEDLCDPATGCVNRDNSARCNDQNACTDDSCDPAAGCVNQDNSARCNDQNACTEDLCDPAAGCVNRDDSARCNDQNACTEDSCDPAAGCVNRDNSARCNDQNACTEDLCDPATGCVNRDDSARCNDQNDCTDDSCEPATGCVNVPNDRPGCEGVCRTPGFWGTHAKQNPMKACSQNITQAVIQMAGGSLSICGECISTTTVRDDSSAIEALCVRVRGRAQRQLARQLTAAALNCVVSGGSGDCSGSGIEAVFALCNAACAANSGDLSECIRAIDCFNNGGAWNAQARTCSPGIPEQNCHDRPLPLDQIPGLPNNDPSSRCFGRQGPAGSERECNRANDSLCTVVPPNNTEVDCKNHTDCP